MVEKSKAEAVAATSTDNAADSAVLAGSPQRDVWKKRLVAVALLILFVVFGYWLFQRMTHVYTDDARISADMIDISSKVSGWIVEFPVSSGDALQYGDVIAVIDSREIRFKLKELEADRAALASQYQSREAEKVMVEQQTTGAVQVAESQLNAAQAALAASESELEFRHKEWQRAQTLRNKKIIPQKDFESARTLYQQARQARQVLSASVSTAQARLVEANAARSRLAVLESDMAQLRHRQESLAAQIERQTIDLQDRRMIAPKSGIVDRVFVDSGEYVQPGRRLLLMHDPDSISVSANIKETQVRHIEVGQAVAITVDAYPDQAFTGSVEKIGHAVTSQFALLPSTNPSGNFTKVTQRLTIKIAIDQVDARLKPGMMVEVAIQTP